MPDTALNHFSKLAEIAETRTEKARAGYWTGRALEASGRKGDAKSAYREAAQYSTVYYGQLARERIGLGTVPEEIDSGKASDAASAKIDKDEVVRAFKMMAEAGGKNELYMFLWAFANRFDTADEMNAVANIAWSEGGATMAVGWPRRRPSATSTSTRWGYPVRALPDWKQIGKPIEKPLVFALARQESEFNPTAGSKVGAQGLMQIMPGTAKLIAKQYGLKYSNGVLTGDPAYNVKLGAAHLGDLIDDFSGSYVLTLVAYNAGPRRSREWVAEYGDLRTGEVDPIDWVESIPFQETRQYVQKVLQNLHVYRSRLAPKTVRPMTADLARGATGDGMNVASTSHRNQQAAQGGSQVRQGLDRRHSHELRLSKCRWPTRNIMSICPMACGSMPATIRARRHGTPVVCLPGLTRNAKDFETVAPYLARNTPRHLSSDFRGRGRSSLADPATYRPDVELADTLALLDHLGIARVAVLGTSRGGIVAMLMAAKALRPAGGRRLQRHRAAHRQGGVDPYTELSRQRSAVHVVGSGGGGAQGHQSRLSRR